MKIAVVGGGTAGWITALYVKKIYPESTVTLIESKEIGILGAGEGATSQIIELLDFLEIPVSELIKKCNTTIKNGIKFVNWQEKEKSFYYHPFLIKNNLETSSYTNSSFLQKNLSSFNEIYSSNLLQEEKDYSLISKISELNKAPFIKNNSYMYTNPIEQYDSQSNYSIHFDANLFANYLSFIGEKRGIVRVEGIVESIKTDAAGNISELELKNKKINVDFVFDCSGFRRLIIGNFYKSKWKSHKNTLASKKAIPFFMPIDKSIPPYTESTAMDYGWMWKIPLQHRYGCGYVFDSDYISEDEAKKELDKFIGYEVESPKTFNFEPGCYEEIWIKNCIAIGLSSGFVEPLEATSIWQSINILKRFLSDSSNISNKNKYNIDKFNKCYLDEVQEVVDFLYLHYITNKKNTNFWKDYRKNNKTPDFVEYILEVCRNRPLYDEFDFSNKKMFTSFSYSKIIIGNGLLSKDIIKSYKNNIKIYNEEDYIKMIKNQNLIIESFIGHNKFLIELSKE